MSVDYLREYYPFDDDILAEVEEAAGGQRDVDWPQYHKQRGLPPLKIFHPKDGKPIEVFDIVPADYDETYVYHMPMGCQLDSNMTMHVATLAASAPGKRVVSVSNPSKPGRGAGKFSVSDAISVAVDNSLRPAVGPTLEYLESQGVETAAHFGESYGADKAAASSEFAHHYDHNVTNAVMSEPVMTNGFLRTGIAFMQTGKHADKYLKPVREQSDAFVSAEEHKESSWGWMVGLGRLSNIAIATTLGHGCFEGRLERGLLLNKDMQATVVWGTKSELALDGLVRAVIDRQKKSKVNKNRLHAMPIEGQTHAMNLDIFLNSAVILQALKDQKTAI